MRINFRTGAGPSGAMAAAGGSTGSERFFKGLTVQARVIGALLMRELHTRYGRENIGYLWMFGEPMLLAIAVALMHTGDRTQYGSDMHGVPFAILGYSMFIMFRGFVNRSEGAIESNMPLLYHRQVTILDMVVARGILEAAGTFVTFLTLMSFVVLIGVASPPARLFELLVGVGLLAWFSFSVSLNLVAATHENRLVSRFVHPATYVMMPLSGCFYLLAWVPEPYRTWLGYIPLTRIFEQLRYGCFQSANDRYIDNGYVIAWCLVLSYSGLILVKRLRHHVHLQ